MRWFETGLQKIKKGYSKMSKLKRFETGGCSVKQEAVRDGQRFETGGGSIRAAV